MITPVIRMVFNAVADAGLGVAHQLGAMTADGSDVMPEAPTIINTADNETAVFPTADTAIANPKWPLLIVTAEEPARVKMTGVVGKAMDIPSFKVMLLYVTQQKMDLTAAWRASDYTMRATALALEYKLFASNMAASRIRGKVMILQQNVIEWGPTDWKIKSGRISGYMNLDLYVRVQP